MSKTFKDIMQEAAAQVPKVGAEEAHQAHQSGDLILDVREPGELEKDGRIESALHIPRGLLELKACAEAPTKDSKLCDSRDKRVHVLCASGGRATLAASTLRTMGYDATAIEGGLKAWKDAGLSVS